jgi:hypothetical protein
MSRLLYKAPSTVLIGDIAYDINTDFRDCMNVIIQMNNPDLSPQEKAVLIIYYMYLDDPHDLQEGIEKALWFLRCGEDIKDDKKRPILHDFEKDQSYIVSAFAKLGVDLYTIDSMHWWVFMARFSDLPEDAAYSRIMYLRSRHSKNELTKEERKQCERLGWDIIEIQKPMTAEEKAFEEMFNNYA